MTADELAQVVRAVEMTEQDVYDVRIASGDKIGIMAVGVYKTLDGVAGVLLVHCLPGGRPNVMRLLGYHRDVVCTMLAEIVHTEA